MPSCFSTPTTNARRPLRFRQLNVGAALCGLTFLTCLSLAPGGALAWKTVAQARKAAKASPRSANDQYNLGLALLRSIEPSLRARKLTRKEKAVARESERAFKRALKLASNHGRAHIMLGMLLDFVGRSKDAVPHLKAGMTLPAGSTDWHIAAETLVVAYFNLNRPKPAEPILDQIIKHAPRNAKAWHRLGLVYEFTDRLQLAAKAQKKAKALGYGHDARNALRRVESKLRDRGEKVESGNAAGSVAGKGNTRRSSSRSASAGGQLLSLPEPNKPSISRKQLAYLASRDDVNGTTYAYLAYLERDSKTGRWFVKIDGKGTSGVKFDPFHSVFQRKIESAQREGKSYFVHGSRIKPRDSDARTIEHRLWFDSAGKPTFVETYLVTRNADGSAKAPKSTKVPWPQG
jgi:tetratricopeptide (TPR) repeat protein